MPKKLREKAIIAGNYYTFFPYHQLCTNNANRYNLKTKDRPLKALDEQIHIHITALLQSTNSNPQTNSERAKEPFQES